MRLRHCRGRERKEALGKERKEAVLTWDLRAVREKKRALVHG